MAHHSVTTTTVSQAGAAAVAPPPPNRRRPAPSTEKRLVHYLTSANHSDGSALARSLALSFSRVAAARRIPVLPDVLQRHSGFLARARHARGNDRKIRPSGRACHYLVQDSIGSAQVNRSTRATASSTVCASE